MHTIDDANAVEIEIKVLLDNRIRMPHFVNPYFADNVDSIQYIVEVLTAATARGVPKIEQTINFIHTYASVPVADTHQGACMFVKQLCYNDGIQDTSRKNYYTKKALIHHMYLLSEERPPCKMSINLETKETDDINEFDVVRFRLRYSITFSDTKLKDWRLDLTIIKECKDHSISNLKKIRDKLFDKNINVSNFVECVDWSYSDKIECELEYIGNIREFSIDQISALDELFPDKMHDLRDAKFTKTYNECICEIAGLLKPRLVSKFRQGSFGLKQLGSNPIEITKRFYQTNILPDIGNYYITEKIDGIRSMLLLYPQHKKCFVINNINKNGISVIDMPDTPDTETDTDLIILDAEYVSGQQQSACIDTTTIEKYYVFDIIYRRTLTNTGTNVPIHELPFTERIIHMKKVVGAYDFLHNKHFVELATDTYHDQIKEFYTSMLDKSYDIDGLIIFSKNADYNQTLQYKWKPIMTIDFVAKKCPDSMLGINPYMPKENKILYLLFCGIKKADYKKMGICKFKQYDQMFKNICSGFRGDITDAYFPIQFSPSSDPDAFLFWSDLDNLDGKIIELTRVSSAVDNLTAADENEWKFIKLRDDRLNDMKRKTYYGNYFKFAEYIWMNFKNPLTMDILSQKSEIRSDAYFQSDSSEHQDMRKFNNYVKKTLITANTDSAKLELVIDLASGKGQDLYKYIENGFHNILMMDNDRDGLMEIINRKYTYIELKNTKNDHGRMNKSNQNNFSQDLMDKHSKIYVHHTDLLETYKKTISIRDKFNIHQASLIVCNLALHYLVPNKGKILNFCRLIHTLLAPGGIFIFTAFDGPKIFKLLADETLIDGTWNVVDKAGKPIYSIKKKYKGETFTGTNQKIDVLLPFSNDKYYTENLINTDVLNSELEKRKIHLIRSGSFDSYLSDFATYKTTTHDKLTDADKKYISLYHFYVYRRGAPKK